MNKIKTFNTIYSFLKRKKSNIRIFIRIYIYIYFLIIKYNFSGGETHIDVYGIRYERDPLHNKIGTASDFGKQLIIGRIPPGDQVSEKKNLFSLSIVIKVKVSVENECWM